MNKEKDFEQDANEKTVSVLGCILLIISILMVCGAILIGALCTNCGIWAEISASLLITIAPIIGISAIWEIWERKRFAQKVLHAAGISYKLQPSGIIQFAKSFIDDIDFHDYILNTDRITVAFTYAKTWREQNRNNLKTMLKNGGTLTVYLPNYNISTNMATLDNRFREEDGTTIKRIKEAIDFYEKLKNEYKDKVKVYLFDGVFTSSYYLMGNVGIMATFNHSSEKGNAPAIICKKEGDLYTFIKDEIDEINKQSKII